LLEVCWTFAGSCKHPITDSCALPAPHQELFNAPPCGDAKASVQYKTDHIKKFENTRKTRFANVLCFILVLHPNMLKIFEKCCLA